MKISLRIYEAWSAPFYLISIYNSGKSDQMDK